MDRSARLQLKAGGAPGAVLHNYSSSRYFRLGRGPTPFASFTHACRTRLSLPSRAIAGGDVVDGRQEKMPAGLQAWRVRKGSARFPRTILVDGKIIASTGQELGCLVERVGVEDIERERAVLDAKAIKSTCLR
jgi:hypothetical protein